MPALDKRTTGDFDGDGIGHDGIRNDDEPGW
jgi:hypothetical protein